MDSGQHAAGRTVGILGRFVRLVILVAVVVAVSVGLRTYVIEPFEIPSASMETTIMTGDMVFAEKVSYELGEPEAGDIVVFNDPQIPSRVLIKRVIATGGQTIDLQDGMVYVDGVALSERYATGASYPLETTAGNVEISYPYTVPEGQVWVMGDNRENSSDSRYFGSVDQSSIFGKAFVIYWPLNSIGFLD